MCCALCVQCLSLTLKLLNHFLFGKFHGAAQIADSFMNYQLELQKLLDILLAAVTTELRVEPSEQAAYAAMQVDLITHTFSLVVGCLLRQNALLTVLYGFTKWSEVLVAALLKGDATGTKVREAVAAGLIRIVDTFEKQIQEKDREKVGAVCVLTPLCLWLVLHSLRSLASRSAKCRASFSCRNCSLACRT
jgi:hypothetical protein